MKKISRVLGHLFLLMFLSNYLYAKESETIPDKKQLIQKLSSVQIPFLENQGQINESSVKFYANIFTGKVFVTDKGELVYNLFKIENKSQNTENMHDTSALNIPGSDLLNQKTSSTAIAIKESLNSPNQLKIKGLDKSETTVNYFVGDKNNWKTNIQTWKEISMGEVYNNIELKLNIYGNNVEKIFTIYPTGSVNDINLKIEGVETLKLNNNGELELWTELGMVNMTMPVAYQIVSGERKHIQVAYNVNPESKSYGFKVGQYDNTKPLIIDPLLSSTFIGGSNTEAAYSIAIDSSGNVYVTGLTYSSNYPTPTWGAYDRTFNGGFDVFVTKFNSTLSYLLSSTFIGGSDYEWANSIVVDSSGNVYVAGTTESDDFPTTSWSYDISYNGGIDDAFVSKLDSNLYNLLSSTFIGGNNTDDAYSIALDSSGNVYVAGMTGSNDYPTTTWAYDRFYNGNLTDAFVTKLDGDLSSLLSSTFIGGSDRDYAESIAISSSGNVFIAGSTLSSNYPVTSGAYDTIRDGYEDSVVSKLDSTLSSLLSSTLIGGSLSEKSYSIALSSSDKVFVTGRTGSSDFPITTGAYDKTYNGGGDAYVSTFDINLSNLLSSTFIGGSSTDLPYSLALDSSGYVYITGYTMSSDYPTICAYDTTLTGSKDGFIAKLNADLSDLFSSTFIGGSDSDIANAIAINSSDNIYITGGTFSTDYPTTTGAYDRYHSGGDDDVFISKFDQVFPVRVIGTTTDYYATLQEAYDAAGYDDNIQSQALRFAEDLYMDHDISLTFTVGCDCSYLTASGETKLQGDMVISNGSVTIDSGTLLLE